MTDPDWVPLMKKARAIITDAGGRTSHAAIVSRELSIPAIIGTQEATRVVPDGKTITVDCSQGITGFVYEGLVAFDKHEIQLKNIRKPQTSIMINIADPDSVFRWAYLPVDGVGLARTEFIIAHEIQFHPMAAIETQKLDHATQKKIETVIQGYKDPATFFVDTLARGIASIAAAFYPKPVLARFSDFKTNEYRNLIGGTFFEQIEANPMLGLRGASRYYSKEYKDAFLLECQAMKKAREVLGFTNIDLMIPFIRTVEEAGKVISILNEQGLSRKKDGLKIYMMCEIPSNIFLMGKFAPFFDGISIGSNDLTQFTLAVDRDAQNLASLFDERDEAVKYAMSLAIEQAHKYNMHAGICGQAPSDYPEIAEFLIAQQIGSISLIPDCVMPFLARTTRNT